MPPTASAEAPRPRHRLTPAQFSLLRCVRHAGSLTRVETCDGPSYALPGGRPVHRRTVDALIRSGWLVSNNDSMFGVPPQTYSAPAAPVRRSSPASKAPHARHNFR